MTETQMAGSMEEAKGDLMVYWRDRMIGQGAERYHGPHAQIGRRGGKVRHARATLATEASVELGDRLVAAIGGLADADNAAIWAHRSMPEKNKLTAADSRRIEAVFQVRPRGLRHAACS